MKCQGRLSCRSAQLSVSSASFNSAKQVSLLFILQHEFVPRKSNWHVVICQSCLLFKLLIDLEGQSGKCNHLLIGHLNGKLLFSNSKAPLPDTSSLYLHNRICANYMANHIIIRNGKLISFNSQNHHQGDRP